MIKIMQLAWLCLFMVSSQKISAQTKTTEALHKRFSNALTFYFYKNTLRMLNQSENPEFDDIIKDIEKMKFLMIEKEESFGKADYSRLVGDYKREQYEEIMTSRYGGKNFDIYLKEKEGVTKGMIVLVNDSASLYVLDILGRVELNKVTRLFNTIDNSAEIGKMIKAFSDDGKDRDRKRRFDKN